MIKLEQAVIVEGKYDEIKLSGVLDALIIRTDGFGIFKNKEKQKFLRRLADEKGLIVMTDSDSAGFLIRNFISSCVPNEKIINVYIPDIYGKEKRKDAPSAEGKLGVEGVSEKVILDALKRAGVTAESAEQGEPRRMITGLDLYESGLTGGMNSGAKRKLLLKKLSLPEHLSSSSLLKVLNSFITYEQFESTLKELDLCE
ncbi:MAG: DUF4093 domain-containing protein [Ruminococcus sp.]|nr:DUF4093 domain-containing protein [Ruminococcus sp.]